MLCKIIITVKDINKVSHISLLAFTEAYLVTYKTSMIEVFCGKDTFLQENLNTRVWKDS